MSVMITITKFQYGHEGYENGYQGFFSGPNSAGGVSVRGNITNNSTKTIKYVTIYFQPYNSVEDEVKCSVLNISKRGLNLTGPLGPNQTSGFLGENMWYNHTISRVSIVGASIEYMDGTSVDLDLSQIALSYGGGCYVATAVYGSYDCPEVWTLRRYRDNVLASTWYGRLFIRTYYAISPTLVKWFGKTKWFKKMWKGKLDKMVADLKEEGVEDTPYEDKKW